MIGNQFCNTWSDGLFLGVLGVFGFFSIAVSWVKMLYGRHVSSNVCVVPLSSLRNLFVVLPHSKTILASLQNRCCNGDTYTENSLTLQLQRLFTHGLASRELSPRLHNNSHKLLLPASLSASPADPATRLWLQTIAVASLPSPQTR